MSKSLSKRSKSLQTTIWPHSWTSGTLKWPVWEVRIVSLGSILTLSATTTSLLSICRVFVSLLLSLPIYSSSLFVQGCGLVSIFINSCYDVQKVKRSKSIILGQMSLWRWAVAVTLNLKHHPRDWVTGHCIDSSFYSCHHLGLTLHSIDLVVVSAHGLSLWLFLSCWYVVCHGRGGGHFESICLFLSSILALRIALRVLSVMMSPLAKDMVLCVIVFDLSLSCIRFWSWQLSVLRGHLDRFGCLDSYWLR